MIELYLVGIGMGNPAHLTGEAVQVLQTADLILIPHKGSDKADLADLRKQICEELLSPVPSIEYFDLPSRDPKEPNYIKRVNYWHDVIAALWHDNIQENCPGGGKIALMIWGDPSLYDSSLRIAERLKIKYTHVKIHIIPGITAIQLLTAAHGIPLNEIGSPVTISTGRQLSEKGWPEGCETLVVMLDGTTAFDTLDHKEFNVWWGAYLGMKEEILISGPLSACCCAIKKQRMEARKRHGWIMDTYLLRKIKTQHL